ncbi:MAG: SCO family protein [Kofleriaceae bacterium]
MRTIAAVLVLASCVQEHGRQPTAVEAAPAIAVEPVAPALDEPSLYDLDIRLRTSDDVEIGLDVQRGHPVLVTMFYASCPVACPVLIEDLGRVAADLPAEIQRDLRFVIVSFDAARDTPQVLRELIAKRHLDERWTVASANDADARTLAATLGFKFRALANGEYVHGATVVALDREGRPIARSEQIGHREALRAALR